MLQRGSCQRRPALAEAYGIWSIWPSQAATDAVITQHTPFTINRLVGDHARRASRSTLKLPIGLIHTNSS